ncbi:MAG: ABC transporter ATP-binding protein [bacterium]|nr:ABC transporter ATP-binding protein [bacterium]MDE0243067.1 ABC transporter ATP-binding protein [bacterium]MDE0415713.1 ABC transporter ATP-binding protein [bacterium]
MDDTSFISIQNVSKRFGSVLAVDQVSIDIRRGEFFSLLGPSGCGKSTLLRILAGFEFPTSGEVHIDGQAMAAVAPNHRPVNIVFQNYAIFPHLTVKKNIAYGLLEARLPRARVNERVEEMLDLIKLPGYQERASHELSGGERQRVALARALIRRPKVLLLDEPLGALDKKLRESMQLELRDLQRSVGITFVFVTHDQEEALTMSDRVAVMSKGRHLQIDSPAKLYEVPRNREVAEFIGTMNFFDARVLEVRDDMLEVDAGAAGIIEARKRDPHPKSGTRCTVAVRPEKISLHPTRPGSGNSVRGVINSTAYLGDRSHHFVKVDGIETPLVVSVPNLDSDVVEGGLRDGEVWLNWSRRSVVLLS